MHTHSIGFQDLRNQQSQFPIAKDGDFLSGGYADLVQDFACSSQRLDKHSMVGRHFGRDFMQVRLRQRQNFSKRSRVFDDSKNPSTRTVAPKPAVTPFAAAARQVDLTYNTAPDPTPVIGLDDLPNELVTGGSRESVIAALQFDIGIADTRKK
jgi:hypothetical protein